MPIKLDGALEAKLIVSVAEGIQGTTVGPHYLSSKDLKWASGAAELLPDDARAKVDRFLGERGVVGFISDEIVSRAKSSLRPGTRLTDLPEFSNAIAVAKAMVDKLTSLPIRYRATLALPMAASSNLVDEIPNSTALSDHIFVSVGGDLPQPFPLAIGNPRVDSGLFKDFYRGLPIEKDVRPDRLYFSACVLGYASTANTRLIAREFEDQLKAFYGAGMALNVFEEQFNFVDEPNNMIVVHKEEEKRYIVGTEYIESELRQVDNFVSTEEFAEKNKHDLWSSWQSSMHDVSTIFAESVDARRLFTACIWYFRAVTNNRPLDQLLESTIAIEVLLGDKQVSEGVGLSRLLGNRCAFLLGESLAQRKNILSLFSRIYDLRSKIVHEGKHKIDPPELKVVRSSVALCARILQKEMRIRRGE